MAGGLTPLSSLTSWQEVGSMATTLKLVVATIKTCQEVRMICVEARALKTCRFLSNIYLEKVLSCLENCWVKVGRVSL